jgi:Integrase core domain/Chromo (CHRromatin Organisation MOdifier) domain
MELYYDPSHPASFGGVKGLTRQTKLDSKRVKEWLSKQDTYTLHKPIRRKFRRRKTFAIGIQDLFQADLVDVSSLAKYNDSHRYLFVCIDVFSKYAYAIPLKNKSGSSITSAFEAIINRAKPNHLQTDKGTEFLNATFQKFLRDNDIKFYTSENDDIKCAVIERWNRTLKSKMWKYFTYKSTLRYVDVLDDLVKSYNDTYHSSIKMAPSAVNVHNESEIRKRLFGAKKRPLKYKFDIGDKVRISETRRTFKKGYLPSWSEEIFKIASRHPSDPPTYVISDYSDEQIKGKFYAEELQKVVKEDDTFRVEKILKTRKRGTEFLVKWKGYPDKFNSWVRDIIT